MYEFKKIGISPSDNLEEVLNNYSSQGWDLVELLREQSSINGALFKREKRGNVEENSNSPKKTLLHG